MLEYIIDYDLSKKNYENNKELVEMNQCYKNIFNIYVEKF